MEIDAVFLPVVKEAMQDLLHDRIVLGRAFGIAPAVVVISAVGHGVLPVVPLHPEVGNIQHEAQHIHLVVAQQLEIPIPGEPADDLVLPRDSLGVEADREEGGPVLELEVPAARGHPDDAVLRGREVGSEGESCQEEAQPHRPHGTELDQACRFHLVSSS